VTEQPGQFALRVASHIERRRFLRRSAQAAFVGVAGLAAGGGLTLFRAPSAYANACGTSASNKCGNANGWPGPGCPTVAGFAPCGPSPCCSYYGSGKCNCQSTPGNCKSNGTCEGKTTEVYSTGCWSCGYHVSGTTFVYTCCDCHYTTSAAGGCSRSAFCYYANRCVSVSITEQAG
jgi:hypothetical protein